MDRARPYWSKRDGNGAGTSGRKNRVGTVFLTYQEAPAWLEFEDMDVRLRVICDGDLERRACSVGRNVTEIESGWRCLKTVGSNSDGTINSDRKIEEFLLRAQRVGDDDAGLAGADRGDSAVIRNDSDRRIF